MRLLLVFLFFIATPLQSETETFSYDGELVQVTDRNGLLRAGFDLREKGDRCGVLILSASPDGPYYTMFEKDRARVDSVSIYYRIVLRSELPSIEPGFIATDLGAVTREDMEAISRQWSRQKPTPTLDTSEVISITPITQNEYLAINPRVIKP